MNPLFQKPQYFSTEDLLILKGLEGKALSAVHYYLWKNEAKEEEAFQCLDWLELTFTDHSQVILTAGLESDAIRLVEDFDYKMEQLKITSEFGNQVDLERIDMSNSPHWLPALKQPIKWVGLPQDESGQYLREAIRFDFGAHQVDVTLGVEGLAVVDDQEED